MALLRADGRHSAIWQEDPFPELRKRALEKAGETRGSTHGALESSAPDLLDELRVYQIELEIQNEELRRTQADLEHYRARYFDFYNLAPIGYLTVDQQDCIVEMNLRAATLFESAHGALDGLSFSSAVAAGDCEMFHHNRRRLFETGSPQSCELQMLRQNGGIFWARLEITLDGKASDRYRVAVVDITDSKMADLRLQESEQQFRKQADAMQAKEEELRRSVAEKDTLLQEVHHRVKNNLQMISSLLRMQSEVLKDSQAAEALKESHQRILSMLLIHERLNGNRGEDQIDFGGYTQTLLDDLSYSYIGLAGQVIIRLPSSKVLLNVDQAIPCGLILNELVTNALKYAYPRRGRGPIIVDLSEGASGRVKLIVSDEGVGLPEGFDWKNSPSMGLPMVAILTKQIGGALDVGSGPGASFTIEFPRDELEKALAAAT